MVKTGKEPAAVFGVDKVSLGRTAVVIARNWEDLGRAVARSGLRRPDTDFPSVVKDQSGWTDVLEDGIIVLVLVELDTTVEPVGYSN